MFVDTKLAAAPLPTALRHTDVFTEGLGDVRLDLFDDLTAVKWVYDVLSAEARMSPYQRYDWVLGWAAHVGRAAGVEPAIIVASDASGPLALFALCVRRRGPFRVLGWLGDSHSNVHMPVLARRFQMAVSADDVAAVVHAIGPLVGGCDVLELCCQPERWDGRANPMMALPRQKNHNAAYALSLDGGFDAALSCINGAKRRKKFRWQTNKVAGVGGATLIVADNAQQADRIVGAAFTQMSARFDRDGIVNTFEDAGVEPFTRDMVLASFGRRDRGMRLYALEIEGQIRATFAGIVHGNHFSGCFLSRAEDTWAHISPGEMLIYLVVQDCCARGLTDFDLGRGYERYKASWCPEVIAMYDTRVPLSRRAFALAGYEQGKLLAKRLFKSHPVLWTVAKTVRRRLKAGR